MHGQLTALSALPAKPATAEHGAHAALTYESALALVRQRLPDFPRVNDVAAFFGVKRWTVWNWVTTGKLAYVQLGGNGHRVYPHEAIARFLVQYAARVPDFSSAEGPAPGAPFAAG